MRGNNTQNQTRAQIGRWRRLAAMGALAAVGVLLVAVVAVQRLPDLVSGATPAPDASQAGNQVHNHTGRPTQLYAGRCDQLGEVQYALNPVGAGTMQAADASNDPAMAIGAAVGAADAAPVEIGAITLPVPVADLIATELALVVQRAEGLYGDWVACGEVGGALQAEQLAFGLREQNGSGFSGVAVLQGNGGETVVTIYLATPNDLAATAATPEATATR